MAPVLVCGVLVSLAVLVSMPPPPARRLRSVMRRRTPPPRLVPAASGVRPTRRPGAAGRRPVPLTAADVGQLADHLAALALSGLPPARVWAAVADHGPSPSVRALAEAVVAGQRRGAGAAAALRDHLATEARRRPWRSWRVGATDAGITQLAVALDLSERTGAGLAETLRRFAEALRADQRAAADRAAALAGPQATAAVLGLLPLAGIGLGAAVGARPWHALLGTAAGRVCLLTGGGLWLTGRLWTGALVRRASGSHTGDPR